MHAKQDKVDQIFMVKVLSLYGLLMDYSLNQSVWMPSKRCNSKLNGCL